MKKLQRDMQHWNHWLTQSLGKRLLDAERQFLPHLLGDCYGKYALLIGVPQQCSLLKFSTIPCQMLLSPVANKNKNMHCVEGEFYNLPFVSSSMDVVLIPHSLELMDNPRELITEACRVTKPEGHIIIFGFNPLSFWGLRKKLTQHTAIPWTNDFLSANSIKNWLGEVDFELIKHETLLFRPPLNQHERLYKKMQFLEWMGRKLWSPLGGVYMLMAKAKSIPLIPIKLQWQHQPAGVQADLPGPSIRNSP